ncbi:hypothetical protein ACFFQW_49375 [Umezawaea endophytica]|uniref:Uncharacterized protein n=1 Tax=Umezawaea endophytica TaxID=1654476 RepID=A0A9X3AEU2_9PSEU|nr:hypothetical protein [Umezawaea endophytica]MCS7477767.1 hypothetical protein [Umezawaea endophytica]
MGNADRRHPVYRVAFGVDIEGSTTRNNMEKQKLRRVMYGALGQAFAAHGVGDADLDPPLDRGDGAIVLIRSSDRVPKTLLLESVVPEVSRVLGRHNAEFPDLAIRLRAVLHAGEVHFDELGQSGEMLDVACRLLDAPRLKLALRETSAPLVLVVSDDLYWSVVHHGYDGIDAPSFAPLVNVQIGSVAQRGWVHVPDEPLVWPHPLVR